MTRHFARVILFILFLALLPMACENEEIPPSVPDVGELTGEFPPFITPVEDYFKISISSIPPIEAGTYSLKIRGEVEVPCEFTLAELEGLPMIEKALTVECIENSANGSLVATATWKGFSVYDLLESCGIGRKAYTVRYKCADGYYTYNSLEELKNQDVIAALYMNGETLPDEFGYPLRIIHPGYFGVRHPGWIIEMELMVGPVVDFWTIWGWHTDSAMTVDSQILFPETGAEARVGDTVKVGGTAFGARRIASVEITTNGGQSWIPATLRDSLDEDYAWVFWETHFIADKEATLSIRSRARDTEGRVQPESDPDYLDGKNSQPSVSLSIRQ